MILLQLRRKIKVWRNCLLGFFLAKELCNAAWGYFLQDGLLVRKWLLQSDGVVEDPMFQIVAPFKFRNLVPQIAHGNVAGHLGVKKSYNRLMKYFYWPCLKKDVACFLKTCHRVVLESL